MIMNTPAAIHFHPNAYDIAGPGLMGRQSAGAGFLRSYLQHMVSEPLRCFAESEQHFRLFQDWLEGANVAERAAIWLRPGDFKGLAAAGCLYRPDPLLAEQAWQRRLVGSSAYSLCGVTHTICSAAALDGLGQLLIAPLEAHDAVICTSTAVRRAVELVLDDATHYLRERMQAAPRLHVQLPVIPLGVDCDKFNCADGGGLTRARLRSEWQVADEDVVILFVGRLSYHAKANPMPLFIGLEQVAQQTKIRLHLVHFGWFANATLREHFVSAAAEFCPSVRSHFVDDDPALRVDIWQGADIFTSLADNIQETFGLTPIEAMAAGLPQVVSDWDGYRDTVRNGIDGFLVPTWMAPPGCGNELMARYQLGADSYDRYVGNVSQSVAVDVGHVIQVFRRLVDNPSLRHEMGQRARAHARTAFDWSVVIRRYQELWGELSARRQSAASPGQMHPLRGDPFRVFANYATHALQPDTVLALAASVERSTVQRRAHSPLLSLASPFLAEPAEQELLFAGLSRKTTVSVAALIEPIPSNRRAIALRTLVWLLKMGAVRVVE